MRTSYAGPSSASTRSTPALIRQARSRAQMARPSVRHMNDAAALAANKANWDERGPSHIGLDTLSWARPGAHVTGIDFSPSAWPLTFSLVSTKTGR